MIDTIIFDLDGTLLNTLDDLMDSTNYALAQLGYPARTYDEIRSFVGNGVRLLIERALPEGHKERTDECLSIFSAYYDRHNADKTRPYDGVLPMLRAVKAAGYKTAIVSNKYEKAVRLLAEKEFWGMIDVVMGERAGVAPKPSPDGVWEVMRELNADKASCVYVGDSEVDVATAANAGLIMIGVEWGFRGREVLKNLGVDVLVAQPAEILRAVQSIQ